MEEAKNVVLEQIQAKDSLEERLARNESLLQTLKQDQNEMSRKLDQILKAIQNS